MSTAIRGIDLFIESLHHFAESYTGDRDIVAFLLVPAWQAGPRADLQYLLSHPQDEQESPPAVPYAQPLALQYRA